MQTIPNVIIYMVSVIEYLKIIFSRLSFHVASHAVAHASEIAHLNRIECRELERNAADLSRLCIAIFAGTSQSPWLRNTSRVL